MKIEYVLPGGFTSKAYLNNGDGDTRTGSDKYTDEPVTVRWNDDRLRWEQQL